MSHFFLKNKNFRRWLLDLEMEWRLIKIHFKNGDLHFITKNYLLIIFLYVPYFITIIINYIKNIVIRLVNLYTTFDWRDINNIYLRYLTFILITLFYTLLFGSLFYYYIQ